MSRHRLFLLALLASIGCSVAPIAHADDFSSQNYQVLAPVITSGGGYTSSSNFSLLGVISEFVHDTASSLSFASNPGFAAYPFVSTPVVGATGGNALVNLSWTAATGVLGYSVSGYSVGKSSISGGPYTFTSVGNVLSTSVTSLTNGVAYYFVVRVHDPNSIAIATSSQVSATPTAPAPPPSDSGGGGSSGGGSAPPPSTQSAGVNFSGRAYPRSTITLLQDAQVKASTVADANASFQISLTNVSAGNYIYSVYSEDSAGNRSGLLSFPVSVTAGATTNITGIFISPTIDVDKSQVKQGDNIAIFGQSAPKSSITITVNSDVQLFLQAKSDAVGAYLYNLDTSPLEIGSHSAKSKAAVAGEISDFGKTVGFAVGDQTILKKAAPKCSDLIGDLNCDGHVNLIDFSILAYWYKRTLANNGIKADLNHDGKVSLTDFSILAAHWTG
ncbi:MAG: dockerin type I repeat-containing protein [Candidatus Kaiserbacteria bacterium]|nr:dockerin type I repeat-containing protein [Candidatus Kaiserbacteria bacterium]